MNRAYTISRRRASADEQKSINFILLFLVWPFFGLLASLKNYRAVWAKNLFWFFCIYFGFVFVIPETGPDSSRYAKNLVDYAQSDLTFENLINALYTVETNYVDIVQPLITFIVSRFTENPQILFAVFGLVFGFFYSRNIWYVLERIRGKYTVILILFISAFALFVPVWSINGFRMWTATHIFLYGALPFLVEGDKKKLLWAAASVFVHFSFLFPVLILLLYTLAGNRLSLYFWFFIITSFITELNLQAVRDYLSYLPDIFRIRLESYTGETYAKGVVAAREAVNWYVLYSSKVINWIVYSFSILIFIKGKKIFSIRKDLLRLFCFALFMYGWANILSNIPSGLRFLTVANLFMFALYIWFLSAYGKLRIYTILKYSSVPFLLLFIIVTARVGFDYMGFLTITGNPVIALFYVDSTPLIDYVKQIF